MWISEFINDFVIGYPVFVSLIWIIACFFNEINRSATSRTVNHDRPLVSILIPAYNEHDTIRGAVESVAQLKYWPFEVILIDDKSADDTLAIMHQLKRKYQNQFPIRIIPVPKNSGKANALNQGLKVARGKYIMGIDSDSIVDPDALSRMVRKLNQSPKIGAVAGKPVVRNRTTILGRLQLLEYIGVIDIIKKAEALLTGKINTVSGVIVGFRKAALKSVHGWNPNVMTEDIDITWRMYRHHWQVKYCPSVVCWILVPEKLGDLFRQRKRWARGGMEVLVNNYRLLFHGEASEKFLLLETIVSNLWAILTALSTVTYVLSLLVAQDLQLDGDVLLILLIISFVQFTMGFVASHRIAFLQWRDLWLVPVYILYYWMINLVSCIAAIISFILDPQHVGTWTSPDRGV